MESIFSEILRAFGYLLIAGVISFAWKTAHDNAKGGQRVANFSYFMTLLYIPVIIGSFKGNKEVV